MSVDIVPRIPGKSRSGSSSTGSSSTLSQSSATPPGPVSLLEQAEEAVGISSPASRTRTPPSSARAAVGIGIFGDQRTVPNLICALISSPWITVQVLFTQVLGFANTAGGRAGQPEQLQRSLSQPDRSGRADRPDAVQAIVIPELNEIIHTANVNVDVRNEEVLRRAAEDHGERFRLRPAGLAAVACCERRFPRISLAASPRSMPGGQPWTGSRGTLVGDARVTAPCPPEAWPSRTVLKEHLSKREQRAGCPLTKPRGLQSKRPGLRESSQAGTTKGTSVAYHGSS